MESRLKNGPTGQRSKRNACVRMRQTQTNAFGCDGRKRWMDGRGKNQKRLVMQILSGITPFR